MTLGAVGNTVANPNKLKWFLNDARRAMTPTQFRSKYSKRFIQTNTANNDKYYFSVHRYPAGAAHRWRDELSVESGSLPLSPRLRDDSALQSRRTSMTHTDRPSNLGALLPVPPASSGSYPIRRDNFVRPFVDGIPALRRIGEAIDRARNSVWLTVTFYAEDFSFPDGRGSLFDVLEHAVSRGLDVRVLFWRPNAESSGFRHARRGQRPGL
jgi:phosphatidylserine/phosphatidylglycerophosphate/cardiolipin synthase-like enzyme